MSHLVICFAFMPLFLIRVRRLQPEATSWLLGAFGFPAAVAGHVVPGISDRVGGRPTLVVAPWLGVVLPLAARQFPGSLPAVDAVRGRLDHDRRRPVCMATSPSGTIDPRYTAIVLGLIMGLGERGRRRRCAGSRRHRVRSLRARSGALGAGRPAGLAAGVAFWLNASARGFVATRRSHRP